MKSCFVTVVTSYRDPRTRRLKSLQEEQATAKQFQPDGAKLTFREKMKMFAASSGENTPRDKAKISRAQRDIEGEEGEVN